MRLCSTPLSLPVYLVNEIGEGKKRVAWTDDYVKKIHNIFKQKLIDMVCDHVEACKDLHGISPRRIYDHLRKDLDKEPQMPDVLCELPQSL
jgi:hypothetical protein